MGGSIVLPPDIPPTFREMISKCLSRNPEDRPDVARLQAWREGGELEPAPAPEPEQETGVTDGAPAATPSSSIRMVIRAELIPQDELAEPGEQKAQWRPVRLVIAAAVLVAVLAAGFYFFRSSETAPEASGVAVPRVAAEAPPPEVPVSPAPAPAADSPQPAPATQATASDSPAASKDATAIDPATAIDEVIPAVPRSASQTIRGTVRVSVRVIVDENGKVVAATSDDPGPSRYFERLSLEAAKEWKFAPAANEGRRVMRVKFNYTRSGTTATASPIR